MLFEAVLSTSPSAGGFDVWCWNDFRALPIVWFDEFADILWLVEGSGVWLGDVLDACIVMIPKEGGMLSHWPEAFERCWCATCSFVGESFNSLELCQTFHL